MIFTENIMANITKTMENLLSGYQTGRSIFSAPYLNQQAALQDEMQKRLNEEKIAQNEQSLKQNQEALRQSRSIFPYQLQSAQSEAETRIRNQDPLYRLSPELYFLSNLPEEQKQYLGISMLSGPPQLPEKRVINNAETPNKFYISNANKYNNLENNLETNPLIEKIKANRQPNFSQANIENISSNPLVNNILNQKLNKNKLEEARLQKTIAEYKNAKIKNTEPSNQYQQYEKNYTENYYTSKNLLPLIDEAINVVDKHPWGSKLIYTTNYRNLQRLLNIFTLATMKGTKNIRNQREFDTIKNSLGRPYWNADALKKSLLDFKKSTEQNIKDYKDFSNYTYHSIHALNKRPTFSGFYKYQENINKNNSEEDENNIEEDSQDRNRNINRNNNEFPKDEFLGSSGSSGSSLNISNNQLSPQNQAAPEQYLASLVDQSNKNQLLDKTSKTYKNNLMDIRQKRINQILKPDIIGQGANLIGDVSIGAANELLRGGTNLYNLLSNKNLKAPQIPLNNKIGLTGKIANFVGETIPYMLATGGMGEAFKAFPIAKKLVGKSLTRSLPLIGEVTGGGLYGGLTAAKGDRQKNTLLGAASPILGRAAGTALTGIKNIGKSGLRTVYQSEIGQQLTKNIKNLLKNVPGKSYGEKAQNLFNFNIKKAVKLYKELGVHEGEKGLINQYDKNNIFRKNSYEKRYKGLINNEIKRLSSNIKEEKFNKDIIDFLKLQSKYIPKNFKDVIKEYLQLNQNLGKFLRSPMRTSRRSEFIDVINKLKNLNKSYLTYKNGKPAPLLKKFEQANKHYENAMSISRVPDQAGNLKQNKGLLDVLKKNSPEYNSNKSMLDKMNSNFESLNEEIGIPESYGLKFLQSHRNALKNLQTIFQDESPENIAKKIMASEMINSSGQLNLTKLFNRLDKLPQNIRKKILGKEVLNDINRLRKMYTNSQKESRNNILSDIYKKFGAAGTALGVGLYTHSPIIGLSGYMSQMMLTPVMKKLIKNPRFLKWIFMPAKPISNITKKAIEGVIYKTPQTPQNPQNNNN
jgi:hypothetical protein